MDWISCDVESLFPVGARVGSYYENRYPLMPEIELLKVEGNLVKAVASSENFH